MTLRHPELLWLLLPLALLLFVPALRGRRVALTAAAVRLLAAASILVAIAGPVGAYGAAGTSAIFVIDRSGSIPTATMTSQARFITDTLDRLPAGTRGGLVAFGGKAAVAFAPGDIPHDPARIVSRLGDLDTDRGHSNVALGLRVARTMLARGGGGQVFLLSDGQENVGDARAEAEAAAAEGVHISSLIMPDLQFPDDVRVARVDVPETLWGGDALPVRVSITGSAPWKGSVRIALDGQTVDNPPVNATDGNASAVAALPAPPPGTHVITATVLVTEGVNRIPENDTLSAITTVRDAPHVLIIEGTKGEGQPVADSMAHTGARVTAWTPAEIPPTLSALGDFDALVLVDVSAKDLKLDQMTTIQQSVRANGKGLVVLGGGNAYGAGNYQTTPLEQVLPVRIDVAPAAQQPQQAILIIIDRSGSMDEQLGGGGINKISAARSAATQLVKNLPTGTIFGLEVFDDAADPIVPLAALSDNRTAVNDAVSRVRAEGGTDIYGAMQTGINQMRGIVATEKHIILMTDGQDNRYNHLADYQHLLDEMNTDDVTFSTVGIGGDADTKLLGGMADTGHGIYYYVDNAADLPQITLRAANEAGKQMTRTGSFHPAQVTPSPIIGEISPTEYPNLDGYAVTKAKPGADVILESGQKDPVLAQWQYGLGRVIAWTPDAGAAYAKRWPTWDKYGQFWHQALLWALPDPNSGALAVDVRSEGDEEIVGVDATDVNGRFVNNVPVTGTLVTPDGKSFNLALPQVGPGRYEVRVQAATAGAYRLSLTQPRAGGVAAAREGGFAVPYSPEYVPATGGNALLTDVASLTGGRALTSAANVTATGGSQAVATHYREYWPPFAVAGLLLFLADLGLRLSLAPRPQTGRGAHGGLFGRLRLRRKRGAVRPPRRPPPSMR